MLKRISSILLVAMLLTGMAAVFPVKAVPSPEIYIDPAATDIDTDSYHLGDTFAVNVSVKEVTLLFAYEFKVRFNNDTLQLMSAIRPAGHFMEPVDPANQFIPVWKLMLRPGPGDPQQDGHFGLTLLAPEAGRTGGGVLVTLTFKILVEPPWNGEILNSFDLWDTKLANTVPVPIVHIATDGTYKYAYKPPVSNHYLSVDPKTTTIPAGAKVVGTPNAFFDIFVDVNDLNYNHWIVGMEFKLAYDPTEIEYVGATVAPWLNDTFGSTIYMVPVFEGPDYIHTAVVLLPHNSPPSVWDNPIFGSGHLVKVTFKVIYQEAFPWQDNSTLNLYDCKYANIAAENIPGLECDDGFVIVKGFVIGRQIDMYTQYPGPYGGQGPQSPSDMFWPQKQVELYANVTYNLWPEQNKIVAFEIHNPAGEIVDIITAISDEFGVAHTSYRIPWPCFNTSALFGIWTVIATVDIACVVVNDTMEFHFDYMVGQWWKVTTDKTDYKHSTDLIPVFVHVTVDYGTYAVQHYPVLFTAVMHDELNYPVSKEFKSTVLGDLDMQLWCQYDNGTVTFDLPIFKYAHAGVATIRINALSDFPWFAGSAWCPETSITVNILAE